MGGDILLLATPWTTLKIENPEGKVRPVRDDVPSDDSYHVIRDRYR